MGLPNGMQSKLNISDFIILEYKKLKQLNKKNTKWDLLMNLRESRNKFTLKYNINQSIFIGQ